MIFVVSGAQAVEISFLKSNRSYGLRIGTIAVSILLFKKIRIGYHWAMEML